MNVDELGEEEIAAIAAAADAKRAAAEKAAAKKFDKMFKKSSKVAESETKKAVITAPEGSVEYWNQQREALGLKKLR